MDGPIPHRRRYWRSGRGARSVGTTTSDAGNLGLAFSLFGLALAVGLWLVGSAPATLALGAGLLFVAAWIVTDDRADEVL